MRGVTVRMPEVDIDRVSRRVSGKSVSHLASPGPGRLAIHFTDGSILLVERRRDGLAASLTSDAPPGEAFGQADQPTPRQREYLEFIKRYILRFGVSPAESDIQRHFLVSAPSVNQMIQTLERRGFIARQWRVPRSIRVLAPTGNALARTKTSTRRPGLSRSGGPEARPGG